MSAMADLDHEITSSIQRSWDQALDLCVQMAASYYAAGDAENGAYYDQVVRRYRQAIDGARDGWANADRLDALAANATHDAAWDAETASCDAPTIVLEVKHHGV